jgi:PTH2 family peptidyl-tRNA hydrolase
MRKDLKMRRGKEIAQGAHASMAFLTKRIGQEIVGVQREWLDSSFTKVCLQVNSWEELMDVYAAARSSGLEAHLITDSGFTEFKGVPTVTCLAIGPDYDWRIDAVTGDLKLY